MTRLGQQCDGTWVERLQTRVGAWVEADLLQNVAHPMGLHTEASYRAYLQWYQPRTRCRITFAATQPQPHVPTAQDTYARHRDEYLAGAVS